MRLDGKVAIVTGAAQGIGHACAERLVREGARVMLADIDDKAGEQAARDISPSGEDAKFVFCDVGERLDNRNAVAATLEAFGAVDVLVNNAGIAAGADFLDLEEDEFDRVLRTNLKGAFLMGQCVARQMVKQVEEGRSPGSIVNMSSINAVVAIASQVAYCVSKGGVSQLTKVMSLALSPYGIRVNAIGPGSIMTSMLESVASDGAMKNVILSRTPLGRIGEAREIAAIAAFLASDDASYITGQTVYADGGRLGLNYVMPQQPTQ